MGRFSGCGGGVGEGADFLMGQISRGGWGADIGVAGGDADSQGDYFLESIFLYLVRLCYIILPF